MVIKVIIVIIIVIITNHKAINKVLERKEYARK